MYKEHSRTPQQINQAQAEANEFFGRLHERLFGYDQATYEAAFDGACKYFALKQRRKYGTLDGLPCPGAFALFPNLEEELSDDPLDVTARCVQLFETNRRRYQAMLRLLTRKRGPRAGE